MILHKILDNKIDTITKAEMQKVEKLVSNAITAMDKIYYLVGDCDFGCYYDEEENTFSIWSSGATWTCNVID